MYRITANSECLHYAVVIVLGTLQQATGTLLCDLYPEVRWRMTVLYAAMAVNAAICAVAAFEILQQQKSVKALLDVLFDPIDRHVIGDSVCDETSMRMDRFNASEPTDSTKIN